MAKAPAFPNCSVMIDPIEFYYKTMLLDCAELGTVMRNIFKEATAGNFDYLKQYSFITSYQKGWKRRRTIPKSRRSDVLSIGYCLNCGKAERLTVDHIKPVCLGGTDEKLNLQCLCWCCNRKKGPEKNG